MTLLAKIEAILFASNKPQSIKNLAKLLALSLDEVNAAVAELMAAKNTDESGIHVLRNADELELVSHPGAGDLVAGLLRAEASGELTPAQLETLTIIAYRGPLTRAEIEQIRGVNCQLILRNLSLRGLVEEEDGDLIPVYRVSNEFLRLLGLTELKQLPDFDRFRADENIARLLKSLSEPEAA